ncbi:MAG: hypothetical protein HY881_09795 [Deltaproteobacteria bacterium]|nr:hypothetical protein [Deltaproteobacteria bacterium]
MKTILRMRVLFSMLFMMVGCSGIRLPGEPHLRVANRSVDITEGTIQNTVRKIRVYALMSELAYRKYDKGDRPPQNSTDEAPQKTDEKSEKESRADKERAQGWLVLDNWLKERKWEFQKHFKLPCGNNSENLEFDIWINKSSQPPEVVVAFRGTDDFSDWPSNLRGLLLYHRGHDQYARLQNTGDVMKAVADACLKAGPAAEVTSTGHSLGGGLAQNLFYTSQLWPSNRITRITVFNSSPMTGWYQFGDKERRKQAMTNFDKTMEEMTKGWQYPEIMSQKYGFGTMRVNERGEILAYFRYIFRVFCPEDPFISVLNFNFTQGETVKQHSMANFAFHLLRYPDDASQL